MRYTAALLLMFLTCATGSQKSTATATPRSLPPEHGADVYALYSLVMQKPDLSHRDGNQIYLIEHTTGVFLGEIDLRECIQVGPARRVAFDELLAEYEAHKHDHIRIDPKFRAGKPYRLIDENEARVLAKALSMRPDSDGQLAAQFPGSTDVIRLSNVYFNANHTLAVVSVSAYCGPTCARQTVNLYEKKRDGTWGAVKLSGRPVCPGIIS